MAAKLAQGECRVWWTTTRSVDGRAERLLELCDDQERARYAGFRVEGARALFLTAHALARVVLADQVRVEPAAIVFDRSCGRCPQPHGKPRPSGDARRFELSMAHSGDLACSASLMYWSYAMSACALFWISVIQS